MFLTIRDIIETSIETGIFPDAFKTAAVKLLLKNSNTDSEVLSNFRLKSNLRFLGKVLEKDVLDQINSFWRKMFLKTFIQVSGRTTALLDPLVQAVFSSFKPHFN